MRKDTHAGSWYEDDGARLEAEIEEALSNGGAASTRSPKYVISPHAGYAFSLPTAGFSYRTVDASKIHTVFILGPSHYRCLRGCGIDPFSSLKTPLGSLEVDTEITGKLQDADGFILISKGDSEKEHSIEMQLPILKYLFNKAGVNDVKVVPIMVGSMDTAYLEKAGRALLPYFQQDDTLFVISSDFCHFGHRFGFMETGYENSGVQLWEAIEKLDLDGVSHILKHDLKGFMDYLHDTRNTICGRHPIEVLLKLISLSGMSLGSQMLSYTQSNKCKGLYDSSVSYCAIVGVQH